MFIFVQKYQFPNLYSSLYKMTEFYWSTIYDICSKYSNLDNIFYIFDTKWTSTSYLVCTLLFHFIWIPKFIVLFVTYLRWFSIFDMNFVLLSFSIYQIFLWESMTRWILNEKSKKTRTSGLLSNTLKFELSSHYVGSCKLDSILSSNLK